MGHLTFKYSNRRPLGRLSQVTPDRKTMMSRVIGLIEIEAAADCEFPESERGDATLDFLFASLAGTARPGQHSFDDARLADSLHTLSRLAVPCPAVCHVARVEANLEHLFDDLDAQTAQLVSRLVAARQQSAVE